jgi:hypothetical protein
VRGAGLQPFKSFDDMPIKRIKPIKW